MKTLTHELKASIRSVAVLTVILGLAYPLAMTAFGQLAMPGRANGSVVKHNGKAVGSSLIGQDFRRQAVDDQGEPVTDSEGEPVLEADPRYFQSRPSVTGYTTTATYFPNLGPNSVDLRDTLSGYVDAYLALEGPHNPGLTREQIPADAVTESASGVDPAISVANARIQASRVAEERGLTLRQVNDLIDDNRDRKLPLLLGETGVNVLLLNLALDNLEGSK